MVHKKAEMQQHRLFDQLISIRIESYGLGRVGLCVMVGFVRLYNGMFWAAREWKCIW